MSTNADSVLKNLFSIEGLIAVASEKTNYPIYDFDFRQYFETKIIISETPVMGSGTSYGKISGLRMNLRGIKKHFSFVDGFSTPQENMF